MTGAQTQVHLPPNASWSARLNTTRRAPHLFCALGVPATACIVTSAGLQAQHDTQRSGTRAITCITAQPGSQAQHNMARRADVH